MNVYLIEGECGTLICASEKVAREFLASFGWYCHYCNTNDDSLLVAKDQYNKTTAWVWQMPVQGFISL